MSYEILNKVYEDGTDEKQILDDGVTAFNIVSDVQLSLSFEANDTVAVFEAGGITRRLPLDQITKRNWESVMHIFELFHFDDRKGEARG